MYDLGKSFPLLSVIGLRSRTPCQRYDTTPGECCEYYITFPLKNQIKESRG